MPLILFRPAEDPCDFVGAQTQQANLAGTFEDLVNREAAAEDEIAAVLDLIDRAGAAQRNSLAVFGRELRSHEDGPVVGLFLDAVGAEAVGGGLQSRGVGRGDEGVVIFAVANTGTLQLSLIK